MAGDEAVSACRTPPGSPLPRASAGGRLARSAHPVEGRRAGPVRKEVIQWTTVDVRGGRRPDRSTGLSGPAATVLEWAFALCGRPLFFVPAARACDSAKFFILGIILGFFTACGISFAIDSVWFPGQGHPLYGY